VVISDSRGKQERKYMFKLQNCSNHIATKQKYAMWVLNYVLYSLYYIYIYIYII